MSIGQPCVEREDRDLDCERDEEEYPDKYLEVFAERRTESDQFHYAQRMRVGVEIQEQYSDQHEYRRACTGRT